MFVTFDRVRAPHGHEAHIAINVDHVISVETLNDATTYVYYALAGVLQYVAVAEPFDRVVAKLNGQRHFPEENESLIPERVSSDAE